MAMELVNLGPQTRPFMAAEVLADETAGTLYMSKRLRSGAEPAYTAALKQAVNGHNDVWLTSEIQRGGLLVTEEVSSTKGGKTITKSVPFNAAETLAESELNRFYIRGLCLYAIQNNIPALVVYRAKAVANPRPESEARIGARVDPQALLADLRAHKDTNTALGVPAGPNSGLSVRLP